MSEQSRPVTNLPPEQRAILAKCFHPSGSFVEFTKEEIEQSIPDRFEQQVAKCPDRIAVKTKTQTLTYDALNRMANQLAHTIIARRGQGEEPIALLFDKGAALIVAIFGVLKAGKMYVLLDASYPSARMDFILDHSQAALVVTCNDHLSLATGLARKRHQVINIDELDSRVFTANLALPTSPDTFAWIHYTSGSTGQPKGAIQNHRNALHVVMTHTNDYHICPSDRLTFLASRGGDIFLALLNGASVFPVDIKQEGLARLAELLIQEEITVYGSVASTFRHFVATLDGTEKFPHLRLIKLSGEPVYKRDVELYRHHFSQHCILVNRLNGTETGTFCQYFIDTSTTVIDDPVPVGYPAEEKEILLLGDDGKEVSIGQIGEISVKSRYLSPGYWRRPDLSETAFLPDEEGDKRNYRTGDLGRRRADGCLIHLGRKDFQVKIRGNRVELSEVETALLAFKQVKEAIVIGDEDSSGAKRLVAYMVPTRGAVPTVSELRRTLVERLPDYMIPSVFITMDKLPLTGIGKVDRRALPKPGRSRPVLESEFVPARTSVDEALTQIWAEVLSIDQIGIYDNFFELGGHSLAAARVVSQVIKKFQLEIPLQSLFQSPTIAEMAAVLTEHQERKLGNNELERILSELESLSDKDAQRLLADQHELSNTRDRHG